MPLPFDLLSDRTADLSLEEIRRYARHLIMPEVAMDGQKRLKASRVLCIGTGGLGSPLTLYLAAAGVGTIGLVDFDVVDLSNLQRQIIHTTPDVGRPKIVSAEEKLKALNPGLVVNRHEFAVDSSNALELFADYDVIADGTDNFPTRYLVNDACVLTGKPNVYGSIFRFDGQATVFFPPHGPCYRCLYPEPPPPDLVPNCAEGGVLGILPGFIGVVQATETVKLLLGVGRPLIGRLMIYDALDMTVREMKVRKNPKCPICGPDATIKELIDYEQFCGVRGEEAPAEATPDEITPLDLKARIDRGDAPVHPRRPQPRGDRHLPDRRLDRDPPARTRRAMGRARSLGADGRPLQERSAERQGDRPPEAAWLHAADEPVGRHPRLDQGRRSQLARVLSPASIGLEWKSGVW